MVEVPEHLLRRSRERRAALGLPVQGEPAPAETPAPTEEGAAEAAAAAPAPAAAAAAPAVPAAPEAPALPAFEPPKARPPLPRSRVPVWAVPALAVLPFWAVLYVGAFGDRSPAHVAAPDGAQIYSTAGCGGCHGAAGEGGVGPALQDAASSLTFPNVEDQVAWIRTGSGPFRGKTYGDPNRPGGQRGPATGGMPGFSGSLSEAEIRAVVAYERDEL